VKQEPNISILIGKKISVWAINETVRYVIRPESHFTCIKSRIQNTWCYKKR